LSAVRLHFVDIDGDVVSALRAAFRDHPEVTCADGEILSLAHNTLVSPANAYGFMDGGIARCARCCGWPPPTRKSAGTCSVPASRRVSDAQRPSKPQSGLPGRTWIGEPR
jgi:hypothetical protein